MMSPSPDFRCIFCRSALSPTLYVELPVMELSAESTTSPCDVPTGIPLQLTEESRDPKFNTTKYLRWPVSPLTYEMMSSFTVENTIFLFVNAGRCLSLARLLYISKLDVFLDFWSCKVKYVKHIYQNNITLNENTASFNQFSLIISSYDTNLNI